MKRRTTVLACALLAACSTIAACGGLDGGQSGTGIGLSAVRGDVVAVTGAQDDVGGIRVSLAGTSLATRTDAGGRFELRSTASGPAELRFDRARDGLLASADIVIPAGGVLELEQIVIDSNSGEAVPARQRVEFEGVVDALDCTGGTIRIQPKDDDPTATVFVVEVASATIRRGDVALTCANLVVGDQVQVTAETSDGTTLVNAELVLEAGQPVEFDGVVEGLDCAGGAIRIKPNDDDPTAPVFTIVVASATIRRGDVPLTCGDLQVGDRVQVTGETTNSTTLVNAEIVLDAGQPVEFEGVVEALDCGGGAIRVKPNDDDPTAPVFTVAVASATIRRGDVLLTCGDLHVGDQAQVTGETSDGLTLVNAEVMLEDNPERRQRRTFACFCFEDGLEGVGAWGLEGVGA